MKFFCATCQTKHEIGEIAADLYDICSDEIWGNLGLLLNRLGDEGEISNLLIRLMKFCRNDSELASRFFTLKGNEIDQYLDGAVSAEKIVRGNLKLTLGWLIDAYVRSGANEKYDLEEEIASPDPKLLMKEYLQMPVYNKETVFFFGEIGKNRERILDHYTDAKGDPFGSNSSDELGGYRRVCPYCGNRLSRSVGRAPEIVIALAGSPRAGKTSALTAIASALSSGKYAQYGLSLDTFNNDGQWNKLKKEIDTYERGYQVEKTPTAINEAPSYSMLVRLGKTRRVLTFVDMPGEFFQSGNGLTKEFFMQYAGMYQSIDCIWLFISKPKAYDIDLGNDSNRTEKQWNIVKTANENQGLDSISDFAANLKTLKEQLSANGKKMPPTAVILSKTEVDITDAANLDRYNLFPASNGQLADNVNSRNLAEIRKVLISDNSDNYQLDEKAFFNSAIRVRQFFSRFAPGIVTAVERNCSYRFYIASASYGHYAVNPSVEDQRLTLPPTPYHEMYPLIWTMAITSSLKIIHLCSWVKKGLLGDFKSSTEGSESILFNASAYIYGKNATLVPDQDPEEYQDRLQMTKDVASNILMENIPVQNAAYKQTDFNHKRR